MAKKVLTVFLLSSCLFFRAQAVLESYLPVLEQQAHTDRDQFIERYFSLGLTQSEICAFLVLSHGIRISVRQLKRILQRLGLRRWGHHTDLGLVISAIEQELEGSGSCIGYRAMWQRLRNGLGMLVSRETVRHALRIIDPEGVSERLRNRLRRRQYRGKGPNFLWHIDGYDKLKPFGFCVHGCIDGFSRRIMWLEVGSTNSDSRVVANYFVGCVRQVGGTATVVRADYGTENVKVAGIQRFFRRDCNDSLSGSKSFMYGKSSSNQRIEAWWGQLRRNCVEWWINHFKDLRDLGLYCDGYVVHVECLKFCYMRLIRDELQRAAIQWNLHRIRPSTNPNSPPGRPNTLYFMPSLVGGQIRDCKYPIVDDDIDVAKEVCCCDPPPDYLDSFSQLASIIMNEHGLHQPDTPEAAKELYIKLLDAIENI